MRRRVESKGREGWLRLTIDPGINGTGLAFWDDEYQWDRRGLAAVYPVDVRNVYPSSVCGPDWSARAHSLAARFEQDLPINISRAYIEFPRFFEDSAKGFTCAQRGDLLKLTYMAGLLAQVLLSQNTQVILVDVNQWKGNLPKNIVIERILARLPSIEARFKMRSHSWDALGLGLWVRNCW